MNKKKLTLEEKEKIDTVKKYLKEVRKLNMKLGYLLFTKENIELNTFNFKYANKKSEEKAIDMQIIEFQKELDKFIMKTYALETDEIEILSVYVESHSYKEMIENLSERGVTESTYARRIPYICLKLYELIEQEDFGGVQRANDEYLKKIKGA